MKIDKKFNFITKNFIFGKIVDKYTPNYSTKKKNSASVFTEITP